MRAQAGDHHRGDIHELRPESAQTFGFANIFEVRHGSGAGQKSGPRHQGEGARLEADPHALLQVRQAGVHKLHQGAGEVLRYYNSQRGEKQAGAGAVGAAHPVEARRRGGGEWRIGKLRELLQLGKTVLRILSWE